MAILSLSKTLFYFIFIMPNLSLPADAAIIGQWQVSSNYRYYNGIRNDNPMAPSISFHFKKDKTLSMRYMGKTFTGTYRVGQQKHIIISLSNAPKHRDHSGVFRFVKNNYEAKTAEKSLQIKADKKIKEGYSEAIFYVLKKK